MSDVRLVLGLEGGPVLGDYTVKFTMPAAGAEDLLGYYREIYFPRGFELAGEETPRPATSAEIVNAIAAGIASGMADQVSRWKKDQAAKAAADATEGLSLLPSD